MVSQTFYFSDGPYLQALRSLHSALSSSDAFVKFIGQPRTGKSGVCAKLAQFMRHKDYRVIYFSYAVESPEMLRSMLVKELNIPDTVDVLHHLEHALASESEKPLVLIFDDAHQLSDITLIEIHRLAGVQDKQRRVINIVLCGEPELERRLSSKQEFTSLLQHLSHNFLLEPMNAETTSRFLLAFLEKMQLLGLRLEPAALNQFFKFCRGFPGPAYSLCQLVMSIRQHSQEMSPVTKEDLQRAIRSTDCELPVSSGQYREGTWRGLGAPIAAVVVIASLALLIRELSPSETESAVVEPASLDVDLTADPILSRSSQSPFAVVDDSAAASDAVQLANVTLTRPMLALDDEEFEEVVPQTSEFDRSSAFVGSTAENAGQQVGQMGSVALTAEQMVQGWLEAWEGQDLEAYFASYADGFIPRYHRSQSAWRSSRERVIGDENQITLELSDFVVISEDAEKVEVHFWLAYRSPSSREDTHKKLILKKLPAAEGLAERLVILEEVNLEVRV